MLVFCDAADLACGKGGNMRFIKFQSNALNGYLDFNIVFNQNTTFLVGINGSGKTSVLRAIMGLVSPDIDWLMNTDYNKISLTIEHDGSVIVISAEKVSDGRTISLWSNNDLLGSLSITRDTYNAMLRRSDDFAYDDNGEFITVRETSSQIPGGNFVIDLLKQLPIPVFLGLDRSTLPFAREKTIGRRAKRPRATLRAFMDESVGEAEQSALRAVSRANADRQRRATKLREDIILTLFTEEAGANNYALPKRSDIRDYEKYRKSLKTALKLINISEMRISETVDPFFLSL
jgi:energy-coupling factor transporter ATP-binding protein EcfA2